MRTRYYVTVQGGGTAAWIPEGAGESLKQNALSNLRQVRLHHGYDYEGFNITGVLMQREAQFDLSMVERWVNVERGPAGVRDSRLVVSEGPLAAGANAAFGLVLEVSAGNRFAWEPGRNGVSGVISVDKANRGAKVSAALQDIFHDIMLANDHSVQTVLKKWRASGNFTDTDLFGMKADFAVAQVTGRGLGTTLDHFAPNGYASFAATARQNFHQTMNEQERSEFASLWTKFLIDRFAEHFLDVEEAVDLVRNGRFRDSKPELTAGSGEAPDARHQHGMLSEHELREALTKPQLVRKNGSYILCFWQGKLGAAAGQIGAKFMLKKGGNSPRRFKLCDEVSYAEMVPLVRDGLVTPIRLFLKKQ